MRPLWIHVRIGDPTVCGLVLWVWSMMFTLRSSDNYLTSVGLMKHISAMTEEVTCPPGFVMASCAYSSAQRREGGGDHGASTQVFELNN